MEVQPVTLCGKYIRLEPLSENHVIELAQAGKDEGIWTYTLYGSVNDEPKMRLWVQDMLDRQSRGTDLPFAVVWLESGKAIGATRYLEIRREHRCVEIGGTWYAPEYQGTQVNPECKYLLLRHAFEDLRCIRVQFKTDVRNLRSQRAIERLGALKEGVFRNHMILLDGSIRDSVYYSILDREWPEVKTRLEQRLYT